MFVIHGWKRYGKVRQVPGVAHVATIFFHLYWVPTLPLRSYVVIEGPQPEVGTVTPLGKVKQTDFGFVGIRTRLNWPSVLMTYLRAGLGFGLFMFGTAAVVFGYEAVNGLGMTPKSAAVTAGVALSCGLGFWFTRWLTRADLASGNDLREDLGLPRSDEF